MAKSVMTHNFSQVPQADIPRSSFDRSHGHKTTFDQGELVPFYVDEALPGDTFNYKLTAFARLATPIKPIMDNIFMETFFFSVPVRQLWDNWAKFNGEQEKPDHSIDFTVPVVDIISNNIRGSIYDHMGLPIDLPLTANSLHLRAYNHIYNNWFRNENLIDSLPVGTNGTDDGPDLETSYSIERRTKRQDYFTGALPWPQKGTAVTVPLGDRAPVMGIGIPTNSPTDIVDAAVKDSISATSTFPFAYSVAEAGLDGHQIVVEGTGPLAADELNIYADLASATGITINALRESFQIQKLLERDARGGTRYPEILKSHFGVTDPQMLVLQRPEFLGGGSSRVNINPVAQQTPSNIAPELTPQGNLAGYGTVTLNGHGFTKSFTEHCIIIGIVNVRADITYQQGLNRMWSRQTRYDYYWPALSHLGEQAILSKELYYDSDPLIDELVFGYIPRYDEYRYKPSTITGAFRSNDPASLDIWHLAQDFQDAPVLGKSFIEVNVPIDRISAVPAEPDFLFDSYAKLICARPMPLYATPGMIDHF